MIRVEVTYAVSFHKQWILSVDLLPNATIEDAMMTSGLLALHPSLSLKTMAVGIFGKNATLTTRLHDGDRVEIYRSLHIDPKQARRKRILKRTGDSPQKSS